MLDRFNFYCLEINTFEDYDVELDYQPQLFSFKEDKYYLSIKNL